MTAVWSRLQPIGDPEGYGLDQSSDLYDLSTIPWRKDASVFQGPCLAYYLFRDLYLDAIEVSSGYKQGDRIDVPVRSTYREEDIKKAAELLSELKSTDGIRFACFTVSGAAFVKL